MRTLLVVAFTVVPATAAFAQEAPTPAETPSSDFVTIDRQDGTSKAGGDISYLFPSSALTGGSSVTGLRFDGHGEYVAPSGLGGYAQLPISYLHSSSGGASNSATGIGDLEVGALYAIKPQPSGFAGVLHAGLTLPTGSTGMDAIIANIFGAYMRLTDLYQFVPKGTSLRLAGSPLLRSGQLFARADIGLDVNLGHDGNGKVSSIARLNLGVGVDTGSASVMAELINLYDLDDNGTGGSGSSWVNAGAVSARFRAGTLRPYGALTFPLDHDSHQVMNAALMAGIEAPLR